MRKRERERLIERKMENEREIGKDKFNNDRDRAREIEVE